MTKRASVALFTPLPPAATGTADYAAALIPELEKLVALRVFEKAPRGFDPAEFDAVVYQIGNNPFHAGIYETALRYPGIVVLHEPNLHDLIRGLAVGHSDYYLREVAYEIFGQEWEPVTRSGYRPAGQQPRVFSMLRRLLDASKACIVHSLYARDMVRMKGFRGPVETIPHGVALGTRRVGERRARIAPGAGQPLIGIFGYLRPDKRITECLRAFERLGRKVPEAKLLIAGTPHPELPIPSLMKELGLEDRVIVTGHLPGDELDDQIAACDVIVNLRWPTFGETSGITMRAFGLGKTVIMSDTGAAREYPDDICVRVPCDGHLESVLAGTLEWLLETPDIRRAIGESAAKWACGNCGWPDVARKYADFTRTYKEAAATSAPVRDMPEKRIRAYLRRWIQPGTEAARYFENHDTRLARTLQLIPSGTADDRVLEMGCYMQITPALGRLLGYGEVRGSYLGSGEADLKTISADDGESFACVIDLFDCEIDTFPYPNGFFSTVICAELLEHLRLDPMRMVSEIYRVLKDDGILVLTTPNAVSVRALTAIIEGRHPGFYNRYPDPTGPGGGDTRHEREYTPAEISRLLEAGGFIVEHIETGPYAGQEPGTELGTRVLDSLGVSHNLRDDCILAVGRKADLPRDPRPSWLYDSPRTFEG